MTATLDVRHLLAPQHNTRSNCTNQADFFKSRQTLWCLAYPEKNRAKIGPLKLLYSLTMNTTSEPDKLSGNNEVGASSPITTDTSPTGCSKYQRNSGTQEHQKIPPYHASPHRHYQRNLPLHRITQQLQLVPLPK